MIRDNRLGGPGSILNFDRCISHCGELDLYAYVMVYLILFQIIFTCLLRLAFYLIVLFSHHHRLHEL